jgi:hypothetical protein
MRPPKQENIFDLSFRGGLPEMLRALAAKIESQDALAESFTSTVSRERFQLTVDIDLRKV